MTESIPPESIPSKSIPHQEESQSSQTDDDSLDREASQEEPSDQTRRTGIRRRVLRTLALIGFIYLGVCFALVFWESRLVFPGAYFDASSWMDMERFAPDQPIVGEVSTFEYTAVDGSALLGRIYTRANADKVVLFLHGNGIRAVEMDGWTRRLSDLFDATVLTAEYRGFQASEFTPTEQSTIEDAESAIVALSETTSVPVQEILIYGRSLGGGVAAGLVNQLSEQGTPPRSIVLDRTFDSVASVGGDMFWFLPVIWLIQNRFDSVEYLRDYRGNVVQIHGVPDRIVPMKNGLVLHQSLATKSKVWIEVPDMFHNDRISLKSLKQVRSELEKLEKPKP